ncbi:MAG: bifunctional DNA primase/polymerase [Planctomycetes bacterium]|nr:bifunctional DNA primase/polymerase [Planctomycetota bacterium]
MIAEVEILSAINRRWVLMPLYGKKPAINEWQKLGVPAVDTALKWAAAGNIGLCAGQSGLLILDCDPRHGGSPDDLQLPKTVSVETGGGGWHFYFTMPRPPLGNSSGALPPGWDVRGVGGQVVFPGSVHPETGQEYRWSRSPDDCEIAELPPEILSLIREKKHKAAPVRTSIFAGACRAYGKTALTQECLTVAHAPEGERNNTLNRAAFALGQIVATGELDRETVENDLLTAANVCGLPVGEAQRTIESGLSAGLKSPRGWAPRTSSDQQLPPTIPETFTEDGAALLFLDHFGCDLRFAPGFNWCSYDAGYWDTIDGDAAAQEAARLFGRLLLDQARAWIAWCEARQSELNTPGAPPSDGDAEKAKALADEEANARSLCDFARSLLRRGRIRAVLDLASTDRRVHIPADSFDPDPLILGVQNGVIDLRTGVLRSHRPDDMLTRLCPVEFDVGARCPRFDQFIAEVFDERQDLIEFVRRSVGYWFSGSTQLHHVWFLCGEGSNGKSVLLNILRMIAGRYATALPQSFFTESHSPRPFDFGPLVAARLATLSEPSTNGRFDAARLKTLSGGEERIVAERKFKDSFEFRCQAKFVVCANELPRIDDDSEGFRRRARVIPFDVEFRPPDRAIAGCRIADPELEEKLATELPGILNWIISGAVDTLREGSLGSTPSCVMIATDDVIDSNNPVRIWFDDCCLPEPATGYVSSADLHASYLSFAKSRHLPAMTPAVFGRHFARVAKDGFRRRDGNGQICRHGVSITKSDCRSGKGWKGLRLRAEQYAISSERVL